MLFSATLTLSVSVVLFGLARAATPSINAHSSPNTLSDSVTFDEFNSSLTSLKSILDADFAQVESIRASGDSKKALEFLVPVGQNVKLIEGLFKTYYQRLSDMDIVIRACTKKSCVEREKCACAYETMSISAAPQTAPLPPSSAPSSSSESSSGVAVKYVDLDANLASIDFDNSLPAIKEVVKALSLPALDDRQNAIIVCLQSIKSQVERLNSVSVENVNLGELVKVSAAAPIFRMFIAPQIQDMPDTMHQIHELIAQVQISVSKTIANKLKRLNSIANFIVYYFPRRDEDVDEVIKIAGDLFPMIKTVSCIEKKRDNLRDVLKEIAWVIRDYRTTPSLEVPEALKRLGAQYQGEIDKVWCY